jgi:hypothetical protein
MVVIVLALQLSAHKGQIANYKIIIDLCCPKYRHPYLRSRIHLLLALTYFPAFLVHRCGRHLRGQSLTVSGPIFLVGKTDNGVGKITSNSIRSWPTISIRIPLLIFRIAMIEQIQYITAMLFYLFFQRIVKY